MDYLTQCFGCMPGTTNDNVFLCNIIFYCFCQNIPSGKYTSSK